MEGRERWREVDKWTVGERIRTKGEKKKVNRGKGEIKRGNYRE